MPAGRVPRYKEVILLADLIDVARPGDEVDVTGIYTNRFDVSLNTRQGFPVFSTVIEANNVVKREVASSAKAITEEDKKALLKLSQDPRIVERIIKSIAPSVYGQEHMKVRGVAFGMGCVAARQCWRDPFPCAAMCTDRGCDVHVRRRAQGQRPSSNPW